SRTGAGQVGARQPRGCCARTRRGLGCGNGPCIAGRQVTVGRFAVATRRVLAGGSCSGIRSAARPRAPAARAARAALLLALQMDAFLVSVLGDQLLVGDLLDGDDGLAFLAVPLHDKGELVAVDLVGALATDVLVVDLGL